jgi:hypothetical protein
MLWITHRTGDEGDRRYRTVRLQFEEFVDDEFPNLSSTNDRKVSVSGHGERVD